jgi:hypothetical protein
VRARGADSGKSNQIHAVITLCPAKQGAVYAGLGRPSLSHVEVAVAGHIAVAVALIGGADGCIAAGDRTVGKLDHERLAGGHLWMGTHIFTGPFKDCWRFSTENSTENTMGFL